MIHSMVILGAGGDLTSRYLLPALVRLHLAGKLPGELKLVGVGREDWDTGKFRRHIQERLERHVADVDHGLREEVVSRLEFRRADVTDRDQMSAALGELQEPIVVYLALPPFVYGPCIQVLADIGLPDGSRMVVEKPFGQNLASAEELNRLLHENFAESAVFRIDHFLGLQTVQNILGLRFANRIFGRLWDRDQIEKVEIIWEETLALEGRAGYYDSAGAARDMIQNHLIQLLCLVAMEAPVTLGERDLRDRKVDVLRTVRRFSPEEAERLTLRARYAAGRIGDRDIPAYVDEEGIDPARQTETFAQITLLLDNWRWAGTPFVLRTGKALASDRKEVAVHFRQVPHLAFEESDPSPNVLRLQFDPDRVVLTVDINGPGDPFILQRVELQTELPPQQLTAYGRLLLNVLEGDFTLSIRADEAEEAWRIMAPILDCWAKEQVPLREYPAGSAPGDLLENWRQAGPNGE